MRRLAYALLSGLLLLSTGVQAQNTQQIKLVSGTIEVAQNSSINHFKQELKAVPVVEGKRYCYILFETVPDQKTRETLANRGLSLGRYLPDRTYEAAITDGVNLQPLLDAGATALVPMEPTHKMSAALAGGDLPAWALRGRNDIQLNAQYFKDFDEARVISMLPNWANLVSTYTFSQLITVEVPVNRIDDLAALPFLNYVEFIDAPALPENYTGRTLHRTNVMATDYSTGRHYDGTGVAVAMGDDGIIGPHIDYQGRANQDSVSNNNGDHGDHVAGIIMSAGNLDPKGRGQAFGADLYVYSVWDAVNFTPQTYVNPGIRITSTSYGNGCNAGYTAFAQTADQQVRQMPSLVHVFSCGNSGNSDCGYGAGQGWGNITGGIKIGKNVIAVGNVNYQDGLANSSSRGPAHDGRIKPDFCAKGTSVYSTIDVNTYSNKTGTSMAAPGVSGTMAQLYHAYRDLYGVDPNSGLIKSTIMNTAEDLGNAGPDYEFGWGRINGARAVRLLEDGRFLLDSVGQGGSNTHTITVPSNVSQLRIMVYWTDYEASTNASVALVNDIDMTVTDPGNIDWDPWILDPTPNSVNLSAPASRGADHLNNMEQVTFNIPTAGNYTVNIDGFSIPQGPQPYYVLYEFLNDEVDLTYPIGGEGFEPGDTETLRWDAYGTTGTFNLDFSTDLGNTWSSIATGLNGADRSFDWNVPNALTGEAMVRVTHSGGSSDQSDAPFSNIGVPSNLNVPWACPDSILITWDPVNGATSYEVSMLGVKYMDSIGVTTGTSYIVAGLNPGVERWFSVKARGPQNAIGRRAYAVNKAAGTFSCPTPIDAAMDQVVSPVPGQYGSCQNLSVVNVSIDVRNLGLTTLSNIPVHYQLDNGPVQTETVLGPLAIGAATTHTFTLPVNLSSLGNHTVTTWTGIAGDGNMYNDTLSVDVEVVAGTLETLPFFEDFEAFTSCGTSSDCEQEVCATTNGWVNLTNGSQDDIDWRTDAGGTPSADTGPDVDHNPGTAQGNYMYTEASGGCTNQTAALISPCFDLTSSISPEVAFWYHMEGGDIGELHVDVLAGGIWTLDAMAPVIGTQSGSWEQALVDLTPFNGDIVNLRFRGITGGGWQADIAIDDVSVIDNALPAANFSATNPACQTAPVTFVDNSTGQSLSYTWNFGAGATPATANTAGPHMVTYSSTGTKMVTLTVINSFGANIDTQFVDVLVAPVAAYTYTQPTQGQVDFSDGSTGADFWYWDLGNGSASTLPNFTYTYSPGGTYVVTLIASNACGSDTTEQTINVVITGLEDGAEPLEAKVYPNPGQGLFTLEGNRGGNLNLYVTDIRGREVYQENWSASGQSWQRSLDLSTLEDGVYILRLSDGQVEWQSRLTVLR